MKGYGMELTGKELSALRMMDGEFQREVLDKLARLETKMDTLVGSAQPGRMRMAENKIEVLERSEMRNSLHNRVVNATISAAIGLIIALHKYWFR
ncbi:MAG TPA: hypothetical protein VKR60_00700 [Candidatus Sulfotelmatobacter sp.]|nr:hypothetical protein [Candidatus Sulfotelmatobacter sp.]